ncbi:MAG TPA: hypothetical protein VGE74_03410 [Gemmata sp.]
MSAPAAEFDGPWKEALDLYFRPFVELFFPEIGHEIDWTQPVEFQDKELQQLVPDAVTGRGTVDKLAKVITRGKQEEWVFVHIEVQSQHDADLARRMYQYNHRLEDRYGLMPVSVAVLGDLSRSWRPAEFRAGRWGCEVRFTFPVGKVADWRNREAELESSPNPFAPFVLAHLKTIETDGSPEDRLAWKLRVVKHLYDRGMGAAEILRAFRLVDWMMTLPTIQAEEFDTEIEAFEKEKQMPIITPSEQRWMEKGIAKGEALGIAKGEALGIAKGEARGEARGEAQGRCDGIQLGLKLRFGAPGLELMPRVRQLTDLGAIGAFLNAIETAPDLDALRALLPPEPQV